MNAIGSWSGSRYHIHYSPGEGKLAPWEAHWDVRRYTLQEAIRAWPQSESGKIPNVQVHIARCHHDRGAQCVCKK